jgi:hypothetical protein
MQLPARSGTPGWQFKTERKKGALRRQMQLPARKVHTEPANDENECPIDYRVSCVDQKQVLERPRDSSSRKLCNVEEVLREQKRPWARSKASSIAAHGLFHAITDPPTHETTLPAKPREYLRSNASTATTATTAYTYTECAHQRRPTRACPIDYRVPHRSTPSPLYNGYLLVSHLDLALRGGFCIKIGHFL